MKILLIDDSRMLRQTQERALALAGYDVIGADDGEEGLRIARENTPDLILLDMMLPKIAGMDVLRTLKRDPRTRHIPIIVLSGLAGSNAPKVIEQGAVEFVEKNEELFRDDSQSVVKAVEGVLSRSSQLNEIGWH